MNDSATFFVEHLLTVVAVDDAFDVKGVDDFVAEAHDALPSFVQADVAVLQYMCLHFIVEPVQLVKKRLFVYLHQVLQREQILMQH